MSMLPRSDRNINPDNGYRPIRPMPDAPNSLPEKDVAGPTHFGQSEVSDRIATMTDAEFRAWLRSKVEESEQDEFRPTFDDGFYPTHDEDRQAVLMFAEPSRELHPCEAVEAFGAVACRMGRA